MEQRIARLKPESERQWGSMSVTHMLAHCSLGVEMALGEHLPKRLFLGRIIGTIIKPLVFKDDEPMRRNSPTMLVVSNEGDLATEQRRLCGLIDRFAASGPQACTRHPHSFFGRLKPEEWAILMYKHLDHHLRQFGV